MSKGRKRLCTNRKLPKNLHRNRNSFRYRNPETGNYIHLGNDEAAAIKAAHDANLYYASRNPNIQNIIGNIKIHSSGKTFGFIVDEFEKHCKQSTKSQKTLKEKKIRLNKYQMIFNRIPIKDVDVLKLSEWLDENIEGYDSWIKHQSLLCEIFDFALGKGYLPISHGNPARVLIKRVKQPKKRKRMTLEHYKVIYQLAPDWLQIAMSISLQTALRLSDVLNLRFDHIDEEYMYVTPQKTKDISDPINLKIKMGAELKNTIKRARQTGIASPFIVHRRPEKIQASHRENKDHWTQVLTGYVSHTFAKTRDATHLFDQYKSGEAPTFHEIRSLSSHLYKVSGRDIKSVQELMGHSSEVMTELYQSGHGIEYAETWANLKID